MRRVLLATLLPAAVAGQTTTASLPALRDDCQLTLTLDSTSDTRACEPVALRANVSGRDGAPVAGFVTFASDGSANPGLPVALDAEGVAVANLTGLLPGVHQLTASFIRGGRSAAALGSSRAAARCEEGASPPIAHGVARALPAVAVSSVPSGGLKPSSPGGCDLGGAAFYVSVASAAASAAAAGTADDPGLASASPGCAAPTGVVTLYLVRGSVTAEEVGQWDSPISRAASATVAGIRDGAANAAASAVGSALGGAGGGEGKAPPPASSPASALAALATRLASPRQGGGSSPSSPSGGGPGAVVPDTLSALVQSVRATAARVGLGGGGGEGAAVVPATAAPVATPAAAVAVATPAATTAPPPTPPRAASPPATPQPMLATPSTAGDLPAASPPATPQPMPATPSTAGDLPAAVNAFVTTLVQESAAPPLDEAEVGPPPPPPPAPAEIPSSPAQLRGEVAPPKPRGGSRSLSQALRLPPPPRPPPSLAASVRSAPIVGHRLLGVGVLVPTDFLPGAPSSATVRPGGRGRGGGAAANGPKPPPPGSPGGPAPLLPGRHTLVAQYGGDDVYEPGVAVTPFDIDDGCGVL